jgi:hypothetical protein
MHICTVPGRPAEKCDHARQLLQRLAVIAGKDAEL